jgi:hypothetical protein
MLSARFVEEWDNLRPSLAVLADVLENGVVLGLCPTSMFFVGIKMIEPSLSAVLR